MLLNEKKNHYLRTGLILTGLMTALALVGCVWTPYSPTAMSGSEKFLAPCLRHLFGTDNFGRDIFSRVLAGAGTTFFISAATVCIGAAAGTPWQLAAAKVDYQSALLLMAAFSVAVVVLPLWLCPWYPSAS